MSTRTAKSTTRTTASSSAPVHKKYVSGSKPVYRPVNKSEKPSLRTDTKPKTYTRFIRKDFKMFKKIETLIKEKMAEMPENATVVDAHRNLAKIHVPYTDLTTKASRWRGAIIDWKEMKLIKIGNISSIVRLGEGVSLDNQVVLDHIQLNNESKIVYFVPIVDGALVTVFKYEGVVYFSTGRSLGKEVSSHYGALNIPETLREVVGVNLEGMFPEGITSNMYSYDFVLIHKDTLDVTRANVTTEPAAIFLERNTLLYYPPDSSARGWKLEATPLTETHPYPTEGGLYVSGVRFPLGAAQDYVSGVTTGYGEAILAVEREKMVGGKEGPIKRITRIESAEYSARHAIRGNVQNLVKRILQLVADYELVNTDDGLELQPLSPNNPVIALQDTHEDLLRHIVDALRSSLPLQREEELDDSIAVVHSLISKLTDYFKNRKFNDKHPAGSYWDSAPDKKASQNEFEDYILRMDEGTLIQSLFWYKLIARN